MRIVCYSDIQYNNWEEFSKTLPNGLNSRFQDQLNVQDEIFEFAKAQKATGDDVLLIHTGDLFESLTEKISKQVFLNVFDKFATFSKEGIPIILLVGNHDWLDKTETSHIIEPFREIENVLIVDKSMVQYVDNVALGFIPYTSKDFRERVKDVRNEITESSHWPEFKYLFTHQGVNGAKVGPRDIILKSEYSHYDFCIDFFNVVFNGHYHKMQVYEAGFVIVGSSIQKDFGERGDPKGFWLLDTKADPQRPKYYKTSSPKFFKVQINDIKDLEYIHSNAMFVSERDFLWVLSSGPKEDEIREVLKTPNQDHIRIDIEQRKEQRTRTDISLNMAVEDQIRRAIEFMLHQSGKELDADKLVSIAMELYRRSQD